MVKEDCFCFFFGFPCHYLNSRSGTVFPLILFYMLYLFRRSVIKFQVICSKFLCYFLGIYKNLYVYIFIYYTSGEMISSHLLCAIVPWLKENSKATKAQMGRKFPSF